MNKAIFLDKDDTLIRDIPYNVDPTLIEMTEGAPEFIKIFRLLGYKVIVISNQAGVALGYFQEIEINAVFKKINELLNDFGTKMDGFYYCPHHPMGTVETYRKKCNCRKPNSGMLLKAAKDFNIDLKDSWMIGDIAADIEAGKSAGVSTILFNYYPNKEIEIPISKPQFVSRNFENAKKIILNRDQKFTNYYF